MKPYEYMMPTCCEAARRYPAILLEVNVYDGDSADNQARWHAVLSREISREVQEDIGFHEFYDGMPEARFCPFCGKALPRMRRRADPPANVTRVKDGGYYCSTCRERLSACTCLPPAASWEPDPTP